MCSRFELKACPNQLLRRFGFKDLPKEYAEGEVYPTNRVLCFDSFGGFLNVWGLRVYWNNKLLLNARSETLTTTSTFLPMLGNRCIIPATAYFEWRHTNEGLLKNKISLKDIEIFAFAGLTDGQHIVILTRNPEPAIAHIHRRMPVILSNETEKLWINKEINTRNLLTKIAINQENRFFWREHKPKQRDLFPQTH